MYLNKEQRNAIREFDQKKELFMVSCYLTDPKSMTCTDVWNLYENIDDASRWIKLVKEFYGKPNGLSLVGTSVDDDFEEIHVFTDRFGVRNLFVIGKVK